MYLLFASTLLLLLASAQAGYCYTLQKTWDACNFFDEFNFRDAAYYNSINPDYNGDPTNGSVNYLSRADAIASGIASTNNGQVYLGVDSTNVAKLRDNSTTLHARSSVRLEAKSTWDSGIMIADIAHMPGTACGVWPSLWWYNLDEDPVGEIDLIEGINIQDSNVVSLHTCGTCSFAGLGDRSNCNNGGTLSRQCEDGTNFDGCGNTMSSGSYGDAFNAAGGGAFASWLEPQALKLYWWSRNNIPSDITNGNPDPSQWDTPASQFISGSSCNISHYFKKQTFIINTDFCGDNIDQPTWEQQCQATTGAKTCDEYITNNPKAFSESFWLFNSIKLYQ